MEILEVPRSASHIHRQASILAYLRIGQFMGYLKGKSCLISLAQPAYLKYKASGYFVHMAEPSDHVMKKHIRVQLKNHYTKGRMIRKMYVEPYAGSKGRRAKNIHA